VVVWPTSGDNAGRFRTLVPRLEVVPFQRLIVVRIPWEYLELWS
jgi:hypothetical protein